VLYNSPLLPRSHTRTLSVSCYLSMDAKQLSNMIFRSWRIAPRSCTHCAIQQTLCVVSLFSNSCGLCLRSAQCCSFVLSTAPSWMNPEVATSTNELLPDLRRAISVISQISAALDASACSLDPPFVQILEFCRDNTGWLLPPMSFLRDILPIVSSIPFCYLC